MLRESRDKDNLRQGEADPLSNIRIFDFEAEHWNKIRMCGMHTGLEYIELSIDKWTPEGQAELISRVVDIFEEEGGIWFAHNGGRYDFLFVFKEIYTRHQGKMSVVFANGALFKLRVSKKKGERVFELRDSYRLMPSSLAALCKSFRIDDGKLADVDASKLFTSMYTPEQRTMYLYFDCVSLIQLLRRFMSSLDLDHLNLTIASTAMSQYRAMEGDFRAKYNLNYDQSHKFLRKAYSGGRTEVFTRHGTDLRYYDVKSMYPFCMKEYEYPAGPIIPVKEFDKERLGVYYVEWTHQDGLPLLWVRKDAKLLFPNGERVRNWYYSPEIALAYELGYEMKILSGYAWEGRCRMFKDYVTKYYAIKESSQGAKRETAKLMLNSLYGKFGQREIMTKVTFGERKFDDAIGRTFMAVDGITMWKEPKTNKATFVLPHIAGFTTCYARCKLYRHMNDALQKGGQLYYCDTDSLVTNVDLPVGKALGDLELQYECKEGVFLLPKIYALDPKEHPGHGATGPIIKAKGFQLTKRPGDGGLELTFAQMKECLDFGRFQAIFRQERERLAPFMSAFVRKGVDRIGSLMLDTKVVRNDYSKRQPGSDGIRTYPVMLSDFESEWDDY